MLSLQEIIQVMKKNKTKPNKYSSEAAIAYLNRPERSKIDWKKESERQKWNAQNH
jgi:hypothetical protein